MEERLKSLKPGFKVWFNVDDKGLLGPTGYKILRLLLEGHTLSSISKQIGLSYRFVWGYVTKLNRICGNIAEKYRGASGGTKIRHCGSFLYALYDQLYSIVNNVFSFAHKILPIMPLRDTLYVSSGYIYGLLDVVFDYNGGELVIPAPCNSLGIELRLHPKVLKKRKFNGITITTLRVFERTSLSDGKIRVNPLSISTCNSSAGPRTCPQEEDR